MSLKQPLGVTFDTPTGQNAVGVYIDSDGVEVFLTDSAYLVGNGLQSPLPIFLAEGETFHDMMGKPQKALAIKGIVPADASGSTWDGNATWDSGELWS